MKKHSKMKIIAATVVVLAAGLGTAWASTEKETLAISSVSVKEDSSQVQLRLNLSSALQSLPPVMLMTNPQRLVFDVPNFVNNTGLRDHEIKQGPVKSVNFIQAQGLTRVIVNLKELSDHKVSLDGRDLVVSINPKAVLQPVNSADAIKPLSSLNAMDFRRGPAGEGRVIVDLSDSNAGVDIKQNATSIVVDFSDINVAEKHFKRLNVTDFGTPVKAFTLVKSGNGARLTVEPQGAWEYNAYQTDGRFVMEVRPVVMDPNKLAQQGSSGYKGERMSLNFQNVDVRNLLNVIADFTKLNIVATDSVQGTMSIRLQDIPWDQALDIVLQSRGLDMRRNGNVVFVAPADEIAKREKEKLESSIQNQGLETLKTESFRLNYTKTDDVIKLLSSKDQRMLSQRGSVVADSRTNQVFVQDNAEKLAEISKIIKKIDIPVSQVMIEARIVEAGDKFSRALGARLSFSQNKLSTIGNYQVGLGASQASNAYQLGVNQTLPNLFTQGQNINLPSPALDTGAQAGSFAVSLLNGTGTRMLNLELTALEADGRGKIVSSPSVVTADKEKAVIEQGTELPYLEASPSGAATVAFKKANLRLEVVPQITPDGNVIMAVSINKDAPGAATVSGIAIDTKHVKTQVLVENGGTVVIGGIFTQEERSDVNKVPFLGDVPVLGNLFKNTIKKDNKTELMIFLTPKILDSRIGQAQQR